MCFKKCCRGLFFPGRGKDCGSKIMRLLFWFTIVVELPAWGWTWWQLVKWSFGFYESQVRRAIWLHLLALHFGLTWAPLALFISNWEQTYDYHSILSYVYFIGFIFGISTESSSIYIIMQYIDRPKLIYEEWLAESHLKFSQGKYPPWFNDLGWPEFMEVDCCAWHGPLNIGVTFNLSDIRGPNEFIQMETMLDVADCYNNLFKPRTVYKPTGNIIDFGPDQEMEELPPGCGRQIMSDLSDMANVIVITGAVQLFFMILFLLTYCCYPCCPQKCCHRCCRKKSRVHPKKAPSREELPFHLDVIPSHMKYEMFPPPGKSSSESSSAESRLNILRPHKDLINRLSSGYIPLTDFLDVKVSPKKGEVDLKNVNKRKELKRKLASYNKSYVINPTPATHPLTARFPEIEDDAFEKNNNKK